jgi:hypothetical protein
MTHRFQLGQIISVRGSVVLPGPFRIVRLLPPSESGVPQYRVTSIVDGHDRVFPETAMRLLPAAANSNTEAPGRKTGRS